MKPKKWIAGAIKHPGAFKTQAERAGKSTHEFAEEHKHDSGKTGNRARLALTLGAMHHKKSRSEKWYGKE